MFLTRQGSIRLFGFAGIDLYLHWSWFVIAIFEIQARSGRYSSIVWNILEYLALFMIVLLHEFGHAMACRSVGGTADRIMLWPLGGVAYVNPPQRPGATLWSIAAGPLVNVALLPVLFGAYLFARSNGWVHSMPDVYIFVRSVFTVDIVLLVFNILPIYPLDGGQLLRSLLWFVHRPRPQPDGRHAAQFRGDRRLHCAGRVDAFPLQHARGLLRLAKLPRRPGFACPSCRTAPPLGAYWRCARCSQPFDTFENHAVCPHCSTQYPTTACLDCRESRPISQWMAAAQGAPGMAVGQTLANAPTR